MKLIELLKAALLGVIEGLTEWLPISSTGHMILVDELVKMQVSPEFKEMFLVVIQLGAILAVVMLYFRKLNPFALSKTPRQRRETLTLWGKVLVAVLPAALIGIPLNDQIDKLFYRYEVVAVALIVYGVLFIVLEKRNRGLRPRIRDFRELTYRQAALIGVFQVLALIPGTSRSGATILGGMLIGASRAIAAEFSFFLSIPVMFGASFLKLLKFGFKFTGMEAGILAVGMVVAFVVSVIAIKFLMNYIKRHDFTAFGWYRIVLGLLVVVYFMLAAKPAAGV